MDQKVKFALFLCLAAGLGVSIALLDSSPNWDDTGITAGLLFLSAALFGFYSRDKPWLWALAIGAWIPLWAIVSAHNFGALPVLLFSFAGAYAGAYLMRLQGLFFNK